MDKIIYNKITVDDNWMLVTQALIDKQCEIVKWINAVNIQLSILMDKYCKDK